MTADRMQLRWIDRVDPDPVDLAAAVALVEAARAVDAPYRISPTLRSVTADVQHGWDGDAAEHALVVHPAAPTGRAAALLELDLPRWDNTHLAGADVLVDPAVRGRGIGRDVLDRAIDLARDRGRTSLVISTHDGPAGAALARSAGFAHGLEEAIRALDVHAVDRTQLSKEHDAAAAVAAGYDLVRMPGRVPDDLLDAVAELSAAINDAPLDDLEIDDEVITGERVRGFEAAQEAHARRVYRLVARERATGELAGLTVITVEGDQPWFAFQADTSVTRAHRGRRLGMLLKTSMLAWLADAEPQLRVVHTFNAASNAHMIGINEALGFRQVGRMVDWQRSL